VSVKVLISDDHLTKPVGADTIPALLAV